MAVRLSGQSTDRMIEMIAVQPSTKAGNFDRTNQCRHNRGVSPANTAGACFYSWRKTQNRYCFAQSTKRAKNRPTACRTVHHSTPASTTPSTRIRPADIPNMRKHKDKIQYICWSRDGVIISAPFNSPACQDRWIWLSPPAAAFREAFGSQPVAGRNLATGHHPPRQQPAGSGCCWSGQIDHRS
jgi:hypothetical protein